MVMKLQKIRSLQQAEFWVEEELECDRVLGWVTMTDTSLVRSGASKPEHRETRFKDQKISNKSLISAILFCPKKYGQFTCGIFVGLDRVFSVEDRWFSHCFQSIVLKS